MNVEQAGAVADGLDIERPDELVAWLRSRGLLDPDEQPIATVLRGGVSSRTVRLSSDRRDWVLKQPLTKLRVPSDWFSDPARAHREASALRWMPTLAPGASPMLVFEDLDEHIVSMAAVPQPHENWKEMLLAGNVQHAHVKRFAEILVTLHVNSGERLDELDAEFGDNRFFRSLRLEPYFEYTARQLPSAAPFLNELCREADSIKATLVHGDFSPKNVLVRSDGQLVLVDYEVAHLGDPAFDLGFSFAHLLAKARHLPDSRASLLDAVRRYWAQYESGSRGASWRAGLDERAVRQTIGCLLARVAGRSQLEYLSAAEKARQRELAMGLVDDLPGTVPALVDAWAAVA
jgi:aminoglycoside phosphotransferase (APT) family kinase protein